tara:strand:- start:71 stop:1282 length:1212 start_codon:yes stop_codon:yes gene_type:complete
MVKEESIELIKFGIKLKNFCEDFRKKKYRFVLKNGEVFYSKYLFFYFYLLNKSFNEIKINSIIKNNFEKIEKIYPGSSLDLAESLYCIILKIKKDNTLKDVDLTKNNIEKYFLQSVEKDFYKKISSSIEFIGPDGSILCKESKNDYMTCERKDISSFNFKINNIIRDSLFVSNFKKTGNFYISVCDVFFEKESDLIPLFEKASKNKKSIVLICRGATKNFILNVKRFMINYNTLLYLYTDTFNNEDPFKFKDFSDVIGANIISKEKGNIIVRDIVENCSLMENLTVYEDKIDFKPKENNLIEKINNQIISSSSDELKKYLNFRKQRVSCKIAFIYIPDTNKKLLQNFKDVISCYNKVLKYGLVEDKNKILRSKISYENCTKMSFKLYEIIKSINLTVKENKNV